MSLIMGVDMAVHALSAAAGLGLLAALSTQLSHVDWVGVHAYDLVFPLFMFLSGVSLAIVQARPNKPGDGAIIASAARRTAILIALGIVYNFGWEVTPERFRIPSVLGLIGIAFFLSVLWVTLLKTWRARVIALAALMAGVAAAQLFIPVPGFGAGVLTAEGSLNAWLDQTFLPGRLYGETYDPEGLLGLVSGASITMFGVIAGSMWLGGRANDQSGRRALLLAALAAALILAGLLLWPVYPPIKKLWTTSFTLIASGVCMALFVLGTVLIDPHRAARKLAFPFAVIGSNAILAYMAARFFIYPFYGPIAALSPWMQVAALVGLLAAQWAVLWFFYQRRWFLRV